jgi:hypothetical protein
LPHRCQRQGAAQRARRGRGRDEELILGVGGSRILPATLIFGVAEHEGVDRFWWRSCPKLSGTSLTTPQECPGTCSRRRKGVGSGYCRRRWKTECQRIAHRGKQGRAGWHERQRRWPMKGNGGEDDTGCLPTGDDGGGGSDQGGTTTEGRRQLGYFISRTEIVAMTCGDQVGNATQQVGPTEGTITDKWATRNSFP